MHRFSGRQCYFCGEQLLSRIVPVHLEESPLCGVCQRVKPTYERAVAFGPYDGALRELLHLLKYERVRSAAGLLGEHLATAIAEMAADLATDALIVPIPLHVGRQRERRFNQSLLIAAESLKRVSLPLELRPELLVRKRPTISQTGLTRHQRRENVRGAFAVPHRMATKVKGREVILVDDVLTTGTTAEECARVLKRAGAEKVWVATVARVSKLEATIAPYPDLPAGFGAGANA